MGRGEGESFKGRARESGGGGVKGSDTHLDPFPIPLDGAFERPFQTRQRRLQRLNFLAVRGLLRRQCVPFRRDLRQLVDPFF